MSFLKAILRLSAFALGVSLLWLICLPRPRLLDDTSFSSCYVDREGHLLRLSLADDDRYRVFVPLKDIAPGFVDMTLLHEDRFFSDHPGVNPVAFLRAATNALWQHGPHPGASTITMQLVRLHYGLNTRTPWGKFCQAVAALHMEMHCSKREILEAYFNLAPYGRNIEGVGAAGLIYFGKQPSQLDPIEAMTLAVIPQSPARRAPGTARHESALCSARLLLLREWLVRHPADVRFRDALAMPLQVGLPRDLPFGAPHLINELMERDGSPSGEINLTLDASEQATVEREIQRYTAARAHTGLSNACAMLVDYTTMEVRAAVGSASYRDKSISGQVDGLSMLRSPGSALKPFVYALAFDQGLIHPHTLLRDAPTSFHGYDPEDFDHQFAGPISAHDALIQSRNVPAVDLESRLEPGHDLYALLNNAGLPRLQVQRHYGLSIALGSAEISPEKLAELYALLANGGQFRPLRFEQRQPANPGMPLLSPEATWLTLDILKDAAPPAATDFFSPLTRDGRPVAWKTGTSFSYRDAWTAGVFDHDVLVVWVGNFDGTLNPQFIGRSAAAPLFFSIVNALRAGGTAPAHTCFDRSADLNLRRVDLCAASGQLAGPHCPAVTNGWFIPGKSPITACDVHRQVWVDNRSGLRLAGWPNDPASAHQATYEFWPSDFARLFRGAGLSKVAPPPLAGGPSLHRSGSGPRILSPKSDRVYELRVGRANVDDFNLEAAAVGAHDRLYWFVDSAYVGASVGSLPIPWKPSVGRHVIRAVDEAGQADSSIITVAPVE